MADGFHAIVEHYSRYSWFLAIWSLPLAALAIAAAVPSRSPSAPFVRDRSGAPVGATRTPLPIAALVVLIAFLCAYSYAIIAHEDLVGIDYAQLTAKRFVDMPLWPEIGRFYPLGFQEYNL